MASTSVEVLILFIASIVIAAGVAGTLTDQVDRVSGAISDQGLDVSEDIRTDIEIISDAGSADGVYNRSGNENITLHVKNAGSATLPSDPDQVEVLVNGTFQTNLGVTVVDGTDWTTGNVVELEIDQSLDTGDHRVKVIVNGDEEVFEFRT